MSDDIIKINLKSNIDTTFRVSQIQGMFDLDLEKHGQNEIICQNPLTAINDWKIGVIVGPSGSGKSTVARKIFGDSLWTGYKWKKNKAVVDNFEDDTIKDITGMFTRVGFSSPPSWLRSFYTLSNGEQYRCELAKALLQKNKDIIAVDEYTSVVDRNTAKVMSIAINKAIKKGTIKKKFVAVSCHYDILEYLEPDWYLDMATGKVERRLLRRPETKFEIVECEYSLWSRFKKFHYLNTNILKQAECYALLYNKLPIGFIGIIQNPGFFGCKRVHRLVIIPDFQGIGIGTKFLNCIGEIYNNKGEKLTIVSSHPGIIKSLSCSTEWRKKISKTFGTKVVSIEKRGYRNIKSFEYNYKGIVPDTIKKRRLKLNK